MAADLTVLDKLREQGAVKVTFHASGELASVEFGPGVSDAQQHEASTATTAKAPRASSVGRLVPRADRSQ